MKRLKLVWRKIAPLWLLSYFRMIFDSEIRKNLRHSVLNSYRSKNLKLEPKEIQEGVRFLKCNRFTPYPFYWTLKYEKFVPEVVYDESYSRFYFDLNGKKIYFPKSLSKTHAIWGSRSLLKEQDPQSPHIYLTDAFQVEDNSIIIDAGVAEGNFAISVVEKAKKLYLIECEPVWIDALKITFAPWKEKVVFVEKYLSDKVSDTTTTIDALIEPEEEAHYFIKMDIEGFEKEALVGMSHLLTSVKNIKMDICTYHHPNDCTDIENIIRPYGFKWHVSNGYVLYSLPGEAPEFRKVLIRAEKSS